MNYTVRLAREAVRTLERVDRATEERLRRRPRELAEDPLGLADGASYSR